MRGSSATRASLAAPAALALALALAAWPPGSHARAPAAPPGQLVFVRDGAIWRAPLAAPEEASRLAPLAAMPSLIAGISAAMDGSALLVDLGPNAAWVDLTATAPAPLYLPCRTGQLVPDGGRVLCRGRRSGMVVYRLRPELSSSPLPALDRARTGLAGGDGGELVTEGDGALWRAALASPDQRSSVAPQAPVDRLSISPDGRRAVGRFGGDQEAALESFLLDGRGARRKLGRGEPVAWSASSRWLAANAGDAACALRAIGGEYKCWDHFRALAFTGEGDYLLLARPAEGGAGRDIYLAATSGVRPKRPRRLLESVVAATILP